MEQVSQREKDAAKASEWLSNPPVQRTPAGLRYEKFITNARAELQGMTAEAQAKSVKANADFIRGLSSPRYGASYRDELQRAVTPAAVHVDSLLAMISVMYVNDEYIGERLMPAFPVSKRSDKYVVYTKRDRFAFPDDQIGYRSSPNELDASRSTANYSVIDYGYKNFLDLETIQNQDAPLSEMVDVVEAINEGIVFRRESRILGIVFTSGNYSGNTAAATTVWDTATTGGTIIADILAADAGLFSGPNPTRKVAFTILDVWNKGIANNPQIADRVKYTTPGLNTTQIVAGFFGFDDIRISRARLDSANSGQTASYARMTTTKAFGILRVANRPTVRSLQFGTTFRMQGDPYTTEWNDPSIGKRGGTWARVSVSEDHKVVAGDAGFLITGAIT